MISCLPPSRPDLVAQMWNDVRRHKYNVYTVVLEDGVPYIEPPVRPPVEERDSSYSYELDEAEVKVFTSDEGAEDFRKWLIEARDVRPSKARVMKIELDGMWELIDGLSKMAFDQWIATLRIQLLHSTFGNHIVAHDCIYSQAQPYA